jgi:hypothetical protein
MASIHSGGKSARVITGRDADGVYSEAFASRARGGSGYTCNPAHQALSKAYAAPSHGLVGERTSIVAAMTASLIRAR